jgi:hypothetical protein
MEDLGDAQHHDWEKYSPGAIPARGRRAPPPFLGQGGASTFPPVDQDIFADAQRHVGELLGHLEDLHSALDLEAEKGGLLPEPFAAVFQRSGYIQGLYLKTQGFLSSDLQEFIRGLAYSFEVEAEFPADLKLPFAGSEIFLRRKTLNPFRESAWQAYHSGVFSAYALRSLAFEKPPSPEGLGFDQLYRLVEIPDFPSPRRHRQSEKRLSGIALLAENLLNEAGMPAGAAKKLKLLHETALEAATSFHNETEE